MSPQRYVHEDWPWWHKVITDLRAYLIVIAACSLVATALARQGAERADAAVTQAKKAAVLAAESRIAINDNLKLLVDCTTPKHSCYDRGQQQTGQAIHAIQLSVIFANYCSIAVLQSEQQLTPQKIEKCVADLLAKDAAKASQEGQG